MRLQVPIGALLLALLLAPPVTLPAGTGTGCGTVRAAAGKLPRATTGLLRTAEGGGGIYFPARGTVRLLLVFASFPDDLTPHPFWPARQPPGGMNDFLDPDTTTRSTGMHNLTHYFRRMSLGALQVIGDVLWVESARSQEEYRNGAYGRANTDVLKERVDSLVDLSRYDAWTLGEPFVQTASPDSIVDMIVMVWRTEMFEYLGEASLGYRQSFVLDGRRIEMGYPARYDHPRGSGVTCEYPYGDTPAMAMQTMAHELGHWLLGAFHPYNSFTDYGKHEYWGILCTGRRSSSCMNAYERERLGWITVPELLPGSTFPLADYLLTGDALKVHPEGGETGEFYYLENHQRLLPFDDVSAEAQDRGLWILHQQGPYFELDNLRIRPADGTWKWETRGTTTACFGQSLPLFTRGSPAVPAGSSHRDMLSTPTSAVEWMYAFSDRPGSVRCGRFLAGEGFNGAFRVEMSPLFSPYSNPSSAAWSGLPTTFTLEVLSDSAGVVTVRSHATPLDAPPARRHLGRDPGVPPAPDGAALAWGTQWPGGQPLEPDVNHSELQQKVGAAGQWTTVYTGPATSWSETGRPYDTLGTVPVSFRVRVRDSQQLLSPWSVPLTLMVREALDVRTPVPVSPADAPALDPAYPNPFNGRTTITFRIAERSEVLVEILDLLGRRVRTLAAGEYRPGRYAVSWEGETASGGAAGSGIYILRLLTGGRIFAQKVLHIR